MQYSMIDRDTAHLSLSEVYKILKKYDLIMRLEKTGPMGFEPTTYWLRAGRSAGLSYGPSDGYHFNDINISGCGSQI